MRSLAEARLKRVRAVELLAAGHSYDEIARAVGFSNRGSAHRAVSKALAEREIDAIDGLRALELERLDYLLQAHWDSAMAGDIAASQVLLKISAERRRWYGIEKRGPARSTALYDDSILVQPGLKATQERQRPRRTADDRNP